MRAWRAFAEEKYVSRALRAGLPFERGVRKPYRAQQVGMLGEMLADGVVFFVHGIAARDERHHAAGPGFLKGLGEEVIMDRARELTLHRRVVHGVIAKGHVPDKDRKSTR